MAKVSRVLKALGGMPVVSEPGKVRSTIQLRGKMMKAFAVAALTPGERDDVKPSPRTRAFLAMPTAVRNTASRTGPQ
jgi:hypothetical protein